MGQCIGTGIFKIIRNCVDHTGMGKYIESSPSFMSYLNDSNLLKCIVHS
jgi:hypothetical protein